MNIFTEITTTEIKDKFIWLLESTENTFNVSDNVKVGLTYTELLEKYEL